MKTAWVSCRIQVPVEFEKDWHGSLLKDLKAKGILEISDCSIDEGSIRTICDGCGNDFKNYLVNEVDDQLMCSKCEDDFRTAQDEAAEINNQEFILDSKMDR